MERNTNKFKKAIENIIRGAFLALGIGIGASGHALLTAGENKEKQAIETEINNEEKTESTFIEDINTGNTFKDNLKVDVNTEIKKEEPKQEKHKEILNEILEEYNNEYNTELTEDDISYIKSKPQFLGIDKNGQYVQDYLQSTIVEEYIKDLRNEVVYILINKNNNTIISSLGDIKNEIVNVDTKIIKIGEGKEYNGRGEKIDLTKDKNEDEIKEIYNSLEELYQEYVQENENERDE